MVRWVLSVVFAAQMFAITSGAGAQTSMLSGDDFFRQATRSISHDKKVLRRLESHPLAHASGWDLSQKPTNLGGPNLGGKRWQKENDKLEKQLEDMSSSVVESHAKVAWVRYPGLESHPQHEVAKRIMKGPGSMISFGLKGGLDAGKKLLNSVKLCALAVSLGGVETLIQHPASMTHAKLSPQARLKAGVSDDLIRLSVGIEETEAVMADLAQALESVDAGDAT